MARQRPHPAKTQSRHAMAGNPATAISNLGRQQRLNDRCGAPTL